MTREVIIGAVAERAVVAAGQEVVAVWAPLEIPDGVVVAAVGDEAGPGV